jgi:MFS family permease
LAAATRCPTASDPFVRPATLLLALTLATAAPALATPRLLVIDRFEMRVGEHGPWLARELGEVPHGITEVVWLRTTFVLPPDLRREGHPLGIYVGALASHELWWDGALLGRGGVVGASAAEEQPGPIETHYQVPDHLAAPGTHTLLLRSSAFHRHFAPRHGYWAVVVGDYEEIVVMRGGGAWLASLSLSGFVLTAAFALALYRRWRDRASLLLATLALTATALLVVEVWRPLVGYTYDLHYPRLLALLALSWLTAVQLVAFVVSRFPGRRGSALVAATALLAAVCPWLVAGWDGKALLVHTLGLVAALGWALAAARRRLPGSLVVAAGLGVAALALAWRPWVYLDLSFYLALDGLFACLLWVHAADLRREREERQAAEVRSARLELEMVKRQLQPHYLMNTLTALAGWVEEDPPTAVRMIDAVAGELRALATLAGRPLVSMAEELALCRHHLATMSLRRDVRYELAVEGLDGSEAVPPAVLHTLVENAVTHGPATPEVVLRLAATREGDRRRLVLTSPLASELDRAGAGTGTRYVEARLREAWGNDWSFRQGAAGGCWQVELLMPAVELG